MTGSTAEYKLKIGGINYPFPLLLKEVEKQDVKNRIIPMLIGEEDCENFLRNQQDIPVAWRGKVSIVFLNFYSPGDENPCDEGKKNKYMATVCWDGKRWTQSWIQTAYLRLISNTSLSILN